MNPSVPSSDKLEKLKILTRRYSFLAQHGAGLAHLFTALFLIVVYFLTLTLNLELLPKMLVCLAFFAVWIPIRNYFRNTYYQTLGLVKHSKEKVKPPPDPKRKLKLGIFLVVYIFFGLIVPFAVFIKLESITLERILFFLIYIAFGLGFGWLITKTRLDLSLIPLFFGLMAIGLNGVDPLGFEYNNRQDSLVYNLLFFALLVASQGIFEHIRYRRVTKEIIELQRSL